MTTSSRRRRIADLVLETQTDHPVLAAAIDHILGPAPVAPDDAQQADHLIVARLVEELPPLPSAGTAREAVFGLQLWSSNGTITVSSAEAVMVVDQSSTTIDLITSDVTGLHSLLTIAIIHLAQHRGLVAAHGGIVGHDDRWMLLLGPTGAGKSTTCLAAASFGLDVGADDTCLLRIRDGKLEVHGVPRAPSFPLAGHGIDPVGPLDHRSRSSISDFPLVLGWHQVSGVLILAHGSSKQTATAAVTTMEVIAALVESMSSALSAHLLVDDAPAVFQGVVATPARRLELGTDPATRLRSTATALTEVAIEFTDRPCAEGSPS